jgi:hypothetical protein
MNTKAIVGHTGTNVDAHLSRLINCSERTGHADFFHGYDLCIKHREKKQHKKRSKSSSQSESNISSMDADAESEKTGKYLQEWFDLIKRIRRYVQRGQGHIFLKKACLRKNNSPEST